MEQVMTTSEEENFVLVRTKDGSQIKLKVPLNSDPVAYATEYIQSIGESEAEAILPQ